VLTIWGPEPRHFAQLFLPALILIWVNRAMGNREEEWKSGCDYWHEYKDVYRGDHRGAGSGGPNGAAGIVERNRGVFPAFRAVSAAMGAE